MTSPLCLLRMRPRFAMEPFCNVSSRQPRGKLCRCCAPRFLCGDSVTEADVRLFPPIFRFDNVYHLRFKLNAALISESYPHVQRWMEAVRIALPTTSPALA